MFLFQLFYESHVYWWWGFSNRLVAYVQEIEFMKQGSFTSEELDTLASILQLAGQPRNLGLGSRGGAAQVPTVDKTVSNLEGMGVKVYGLKPPNLEDPNADISWDNIAGYDNQKR